MESRIRLMVITIAVLLSVIAGIAAAWLKVSGGSSSVDAVLYGSGAFGGALALLLLIIQVYRSL